MNTKIMAAIENSLNGGIMSSAEGKAKCVNDFLSHAHRYLQSEMFEFVLDFIQVNAVHYKEDPNRWFDGRNEHVGRICAEICDLAGSVEVTDWKKELLSKTFPPFVEAENVRLDEDTEALYRRA